MLKLRDLMRLRHYSLKTEDAYRIWIGRYLEWLARNGGGFESSEDRMGAFLTHRAHLGDAAATQNQAFNAILFLYRDILKMKLGDVHGLRAKRPATVRHAPSREDVLWLLNAARDVHGYPTVLVVKLLYGCGLRVSEPLNLRVKDVDVGHSRLVIRGAKGGKDRVVPVPCALMGEIVAHMRRARLMWADDVKAGLPLALPGNLARKYPRAPFSWQWAWVFPSKSACIHPRTGERVRFRMHEANVQRCVKRAAVGLGLEGGITPHHLRHAYATHVLDAGGNVRDLQAALGHAHLDTTMGYLHAEAGRVRSPLELPRPVNVVAFPELMRRAS